MNRFGFHFDAGSGAGGGGAAAGAGAAQGAAGEGAAAGGTDAGAGAAGGAADGSLLAQGAGAAGATDPNAWLLEQHRVMGADGKLDETASVRKQAENYTTLAKRMREVGAPPKSADEYTFAVPDTLKEHYDPAKDEMFGDFKAKALEAGLTQKQFETVMNAYAERMPRLAESLFEGQYQKGEQALKKHWKTDERMQHGLRDAAVAVKGFMPEAFDAQGNVGPELRGLMNDPFFLRFAAHFGAQMHEDTSPVGGLPASSPYRAMTRQQLEGHEAYLNSRHPDHQVVSRTVQALYHRETGEDLPG